MLVATPGAAQSYVELILDASGSMWNRLEDGRSRFMVAQGIVYDISDRLSYDPQLKVGLRIFGAQYAALEEGACEDSRLVVALGNNSELSSTVANVQARGASPIAFSLLEAARDFPENADHRQIILVTDGEESCGGNLVSVAASLRQQGIDLDLHIVGFDAETDTSEANTFPITLGPINEGWSFQRDMFSLLQAPP
jgi:Ca-activated chloride channel family protein